MDYCIVLALSYDYFNSWLVFHWIFKSWFLLFSAIVTTLPLMTGMLSISIQWVKISKWKLVMILRCELDGLPFGLEKKRAKRRLHQWKQNFSLCFKCLRIISEILLSSLMWRNDGICNLVKLPIYMGILKGFGQPFVVVGQQWHNVKHSRALSIYSFQLLYIVFSARSNPNFASVLKILVNQCLWWALPLHLMGSQSWPQGDCT